MSLINVTLYWREERRGAWPGVGPSNGSFTLESRVLGESAGRRSLQV